MFKNIFIFCSFLICFKQIESVLNPKVVCYHESWAAYRVDQGAMTVDDIDPKLCTHIMYAYLGINSSNELNITDPNIMIVRHDFENLAKLKGDSKALIAIGSSALHDEVWQGMVSKEADRTTFVESVVSFLQTYNFDGISLDWVRGIWEEEDFENYEKLCKQFHEKFDGKYTLGVTAPPTPINFETTIEPYVDFISVITYDLHGPFEPTVVNYADPLDWQLQVMNSYYEKGFTMNKLLMTIPFFGHSWTLEDASKTEIGSKATGPGKAGPWTQVGGFLSYNEICSEIKENADHWVRHYEESVAGNYAVNDKTWITFENNVTCKQKSQNITTEGFGGITVQALGNEDFRGICGDKYPLLKAINDGLNKESIAPRTTTPFPVWTPDPQQICQKEGQFRDPKDCNVYHICNEFFPGVITDDKKNCPKDEAFDEKDHKCKDKKEVPDCH